MTVAQSEIDALLRETEQFVAEVGGAPPRAAPRASSGPGTPSPSLPHDVSRLLRLRVPVIVQLARRRMPIGEVRSLSLGSILEFERSVEDPLDLTINNQLVGHGTCVKVGENFGLRVTDVCDPAQRVRSMGAGR